MTPDQQALIARLDGFVSQLHERLQAVFAEAAGGIADLMQQRPGELGPIRAALGAVESLSKQLLKTLKDSWDQRIEGMFRAHGDDFVSVGEDRVEDARQAIEQAVERFKLQQESHCLGAMYPAVQIAMAKTRPCTSCGAPLQLQVPYEAESVSCSSCRAVNQLMPEPLVSNYFLYGQEIFPAAAAHAIRVELECAQKLVDRQLRNTGIRETPEALQQREALERRYWETYATTKASFLRRPVEAALIDGRMARFRENARS
ncbi:MAG: hypothetical protein H6718_30180 [Polyangiaceae bacterium]|nr:hypothetical protein [Myxococcales bacterium]MCB9589721.1 hypothetical protein [Polyangiaceae bacterium]